MSSQAVGFLSFIEDDYEKIERLEEELEIIRADLARLEKSRFFFVRKSFGKSWKFNKYLEAETIRAIESTYESMRED